MSAGPDSEILSPGTMELPDILDIKAAPVLAEELLTLRGKALDIDASRVQRLGGQCLQVLLSASMTWKADGNPLALTKASDDFLEGLGRLSCQRGLALLTIPAICVRPHRVTVSCSKHPLIQWEAVKAFAFCIAAARLAPPLWAQVQPLSDFSKHEACVAKAF